MVALEINQSEYSFHRLPSPALFDFLPNQSGETFPYICRHKLWLCVETFMWAKNRMSIFGKYPKRSTHSFIHSNNNKW